VDERDIKEGGVANGNVEEIAAHRSGGLVMAKATNAGELEVMTPVPAKANEVELRSVKFEW
jgi:hypothetical protein